MTQLPRQPYAGGPPSQATRLNDWQQIAKVVDGELGFGTPTQGIDNMAGYWYAEQTPASANTNFTVTHNLGRIPTGWLTVYIDQPGIIYAGSAAWTTTTISLKCSVSSANVKVFVI